MAKKKSTNNCEKNVCVHSDGKGGKWINDKDNGNKIHIGKNGKVNVFDNTKKIK